jgi:hypothetical protein
MNLLFWGMVMGTVGKVILGLAVLRVHMIILREQKIDGAVLRSMKREQLITIFGILFIIFGFFLESYFYNSLNLFSCQSTACSAAVIESVL